MTDVLGNMRAAVEKRGPKVPVPKRTDKTVAPEVELVGSLDGAEEPAEVNTAPVRRAPRRAAGRPAGGLSGRLMRVQLNVEQERWLMNVVGDAFKDGRRISETAIVRLAVDQLRQQGGWAELRRHIG